MTGGPPRLGGMDMVFLALDGTRSVGHLVLLLDLAGDLDVDTARERVASRVPHHALLRRRLVTVPLGAGRPFWEEVAPDLGDHVTTAALPDGLGLPELAAAALELVRDPLPRDRPLWRLDLLRTPSGARTVAAVSVHHAAGDGIAIRDLVSDLLDPLWDDDEVATAADPGTPVSGARRWAGALDLPASAVAAAPTLTGLAPRAVATAAAAAVTAPLRVRGRGGTAPRVLHGSVGRERSLAFGQVPLASARVLKESHGATVNDAILAATAGALRRLLVELGAVPRQPLHAAVPASRRDRGRTGAEGANRFGVVRCALPVHEPTVEGRLEIVRASMRAVRERPGDATLDVLARFAVPALATPAVRAMAGLGLARRLPAPVDLMVSNVPMPPVARTFAGLRLRALRPVPLVTEGLGLNVTVHGYDDQLFYSVMSSPQVLPSTERLVELLEEEHRLLAGLAAGF
jgi:diacylglycerol O-acyltransferase